MKNDNKLSLSEMIENSTIDGAFHLDTVPGINSIDGLNKTFLMFYEYPNRRQIFMDLLSKSEWGGSTLISTLNRPSLLSALRFGGVDYLVQGKTYMVPNNLFTDINSINRTIAKKWKGKIYFFDDVQDEANSIIHVRDLKLLHGKLPTN